MNCCAESGTSLCNLKFQSNVGFFTTYPVDLLLLRSLLHVKPKEKIDTKKVKLFSFFNYYSYLTLTLQNLETIDSSGKLLKHSIN